MRVQLMLTCLCDMFYGEVGIATVKVLEHCGCTVEFIEGQTCCGQPPFNSGDWPVAKKVAERTLELLDGKGPIVTPSASCAAMLHEGYPMLGLQSPRAYELCQFIDQVVRPASWPDLTTARTVAFHRSCHGRMLGLGDTQERVLGLMKNLKVAVVRDSEQCCGFGGAFSVTHGATSSGVGLAKLECLAETGVDEVVSGDMGCLMHLMTLSDRHDRKIKVRHIAEVLAEAI